MCAKCFADGELNRARMVRGDRGRMRACGQLIGLPLKGSQNLLPLPAHGLAFIDGIAAFSAVNALAGQAGS